MRWRNWRRREREMEEEIAFHLARQRHAAPGAAPEAAFGGVDRVREELRDLRPWRRLRDGGRDLRQALRLLRRQPGWSLTLVLTLGVGAGTLLGGAGLVYAALLRPLPYRDAGALVWLSLDNPRQAASDLPIATPSELKAWAPELDRLFSAWSTVSIGGAGDDWQVEGEAMTPLERGAGPGFFQMLGVRPALGRLFLPGDYRQGAGAPVAGVVISHAFWRQAFGGDPQVLGKRLYSRFGSLAGMPVIGVLPASFQLDKPNDMWLPLTTPRSTEEYRYAYIVGRRRAGVTNAAVSATLTALEARNPPPVDPRLGPQPFTVTAQPIAARLRGALRQPLELLLAAGACLWLLACVNAAILLLARTRRRQPELATRLALGCPRGRLARQMLLEAGLLALAAAALGGGAAWAGLRLLAAGGTGLLPPETLRALVDLHALGGGWGWSAAAVVLALATAAVAGLAPAVIATRARLQNNAPAAGRQRGFHWLVASEVALATLLALGAGLLGRSFATLAAVPPGFQPRGRISFDLELPIARCATPAACRSGPSETTLATPYLEHLLAGLRALPGVTTAAAGSIPLDEGEQDSPLAPARMIEVFPMIVTPGYFGAIGTPVVEGRDFNAGDVYAGPKKVIVSEGFVRQFLPGLNPIGRHVQLSRCESRHNGAPGPLNNPDPAGCIIVGVVGDIHLAGLDEPAPPAAYLDFRQDPTPGLTFLIASRLPAAATLAEVRGLLDRLPTFAGQRPFLYPTRPLEATVADSIATPRFRAWLGGLAALLALLIAAIGIEGVETYAIERRMHEMGVRMALGARRSDIARLILRQALGWTVAGAAVGLAAGLASTRALASVLFGIRPWDVTTYAAVMTLLLAIAALAAWLPARRAARTDPAIVLRAE